MGAGCRQFESGCPDQRSINIRMNIWKIRFANLNLDYDQDRVAEEIRNLTILEELIPNKDKISDQNILPLFTQQQLDNVIWGADINDDNADKPKGIWKSCSLTYLDNEYKDKSMLGQPGLRNSNITPWQWRTDIDIPYIRQIADSLNFKMLTTVRVLTMDAGCIGLVHNDDPEGKFYKSLGYSVTLNVSDGSTSMVYTENNRRQELKPDKCFVFRDDCWHGIPETTSHRIQIRINGIPDTKTIKNLLDMDSIIPVA